MSSKNNPEARGRMTELRKFNGKEVRPVLYIKGSRRYMAGQFDNGELALDPRTKEPVPYKNI